MWSHVVLLVRSVRCESARAGGLVAVLSSDKMLWRPTLVNKAPAVWVKMEIRWSQRGGPPLGLGARGWAPGEAYTGHWEASRGMGGPVAELVVWKKHQSREMKQRGRRKPWEDEWLRWIARGNTERRTRTPREKRAWIHLSVMMCCCVTGLVLLSYQKNPVIFSFTLSHPGLHVSITAVRSQK